MGIIGFVDDYIKIFKKNKKGLKGRFKVIGQVVLGLIVGVTLYFHPEVTMRERTNTIITEQYRVEKIKGEDIKSTMTTVPFFKNNELDYSNLISWVGEKAVSICMANFYSNCHLNSYRGFQWSKSYRWH